MSLNERIRADMVSAMKAQERDRVSVLRMLVSTLKDEAIKQKGDLDDDATLKVLMSYAKKREETLAEMSKAGRDDLADRERVELEIVRSYLPEPMDEAALASLVGAVIEELGATSMKDMGAVMKECTERVAGRATGGQISSVVKSRLSS